MTDDRKCGLALILGTAGLLVIMAFHPTSGDARGQVDSLVRRNIAVHSLALACLPLLFLGALGMYRRLAAPGGLSLSGLVLYAFAVIASMNAAIASGFVGSYLLQRIATADSAASVMWRDLMRYTFSVNQAFALVMVVASSLAILLWSIAILRSGALSRGLGLYGSIAGSFGVLGVLSGYTMATMHGFGGLVMLSQGVWYVASGLQLFNSTTAGPGRGRAD